MAAGRDKSEKMKSAQTEISDVLSSKLKLRRLPKLRELDSNPSAWNGQCSEIVYGIFQTKFYVVDSDFLLDPYAQSSPPPGSFSETYQYSVRGIIREALAKNDGFKRSYEDLLYNLDTVLREVDYSNYSFEKDASFLSSAGAKLSHLRRFGAKKRVPKNAGKRKKKTGSGHESQELGSSPSTWASDINSENPSSLHLPSATEHHGDFSSENVGLGRFFNFVVSVERIIKERLFVKDLSEKYFFRTFSDFVQAVFMDGNPTNDIFIYDHIQQGCMTFYSPVDNHQLLVQSDSDLIIQQDDGQTPQKTVAVVQCKYTDRSLQLKCKERCPSPELKSDDEESSPQMPSKDQDKADVESTSETETELEQMVIADFDPEICRLLSSKESQEFEGILPQCVGDIFTSFDQPSLFDKRIDPLEIYKNKSYRLGISVLGLRVMFVAIVIVDPKSRGKPHPTLLPGSLHRKLGMRTDVFVTRQFDLLNFADRKSIAKILLAISQFDKVFKR